MSKICASFLSDRLPRLIETLNSKLSATIKERDRFISRYVSEATKAYNRKWWVLFPIDKSTLKKRYVYRPWKLRTDVQDRISRYCCQIDDCENDIEIANRLLLHAKIAWGAQPSFRVQLNDDEIRFVVKYMKDAQ